MIEYTTVHTGTIIIICCNIVDTQNIVYKQQIHTLKAGKPLRKYKNTAGELQGKIKSGTSYPSLLLVKFTQAFDVNSILANQNQIQESSRSITINPEMTLEERQSKSIILCEHWNLIQQKVDPKTFKIHNKQLLADDQLYDKNMDFKFVTSTSLNKPNNDISNISPENNTP